MTPPQKNDISRFEIHCPHHFLTNFQAFSELAFSFSLTFETFYKSLLFSLIMGFVGGVLPAFLAARRNIVEALRVT